MNPAAVARRPSPEPLVHGAFILTGMVTTLLGPILPVLVGTWRLSDAQAGACFTALFTGSLLGVGATSLLLPRARVGACLGAGYVGMAAGVLGILWHPWTLVVAAIAACGLGTGLAIPASNVFVSEMNPARRAAALSVLNLMWGVGAVLVPVLISLALRRAALPGLLVALSAALVLAALATAPIGARPAPAAATPAVPYARLLVTRPGAALGLMFFLYVGTETAVGGWVAALAKRLAASTAAATWLLAPSLFWGALLAGRALSPGLLRRLGERALAIAGLVLAGGGVTLLLLAPNVSTVLGASALTGLGLAAVFPITVALLATFFGTDERRAAGPMFALAGIGGATLPWLVGFASQHAGSLKIGLLVPLVSLLALVLLHALYDAPRTGPLHPARSAR